MVNLACIGINHRTAPVDVREKIWFSAQEADQLLPALREKFTDECVLISTCNRTELYYVPGAAPTGTLDLLDFLIETKHAAPAVKRDHFYFLNSLHAAEHLFKVTTAVDSMVIGDVQVLNQVKEAFTSAMGHKTTGPVLNKLFNQALHTGKRSRTETEIGEGAVSVSYAAAELASKIFEDLSKRTALLIGAGETGELAAKHLVSKRLGKLLIANRTRERAETLALDLGGRVIDFNAIKNELNGVDIIVSSIHAERYLLTRDDVQQARRHRGAAPLFIIDLGVPRNIDPSINSLEGVFLHDVDSLNSVVDTNIAQRQSETPRVNEIILEELKSFNAWAESLEVTPTIAELRDNFEAIRNEEVEKHLHRFPPESHEAIELLTRRIVNKILHTPMVNLKSNNGGAYEEPVKTKVRILRSLFGLDKSTS
jgi:glutamyl-tRNA reductase